MNLVLSYVYWVLKYCKYLMEFSLHLQLKFPDRGHEQRVGRLGNHSCSFPLKWHYGQSKVWGRSPILGKTSKTDEASLHPSLPPSFPRALVETFFFSVPLLVPKSQLIDSTEWSSPAFYGCDSQPVLKDTAE